MNLVFNIASQTENLKIAKIYATCKIMLPNHFFSLLKLYELLMFEKSYFKVLFYYY